MSHSSHVFTLIPPGYEKLAKMVRSDVPLEKCLIKLVQIMHDDELDVFNLQLEAGDYVSKVAELKHYFILQQRIAGRPPSQLDAATCPVFARYQQLIDKLESTLFTFIKDFYQWQPLASALYFIDEFELPFQRELILTADMPLAEYIKQVKRAFLHCQQIAAGTMTAKEWLLHFTHILARSVETSSEEMESKLDAFRRKINDLISQWDYYYWLLNDKRKCVSLEELQSAKYKPLPVPSAEAAMAYQPAANFDEPYAASGAASNFADVFFRIGLLFTVSSQLGRAAGLTTPSVSSNALCVTGESSQSLAVTPMQLMTAQQSLSVKLQDAGYVKTPPDKQIMPDMVQQKDNAVLLKTIDSALMKRVEILLYAARAPVADNAKAGMNPQQIAIANLGMRKQPVQVIKHYTAYQSPELVEDKYMYVDAAATHAFTSELIPHELMMQLAMDLNKDHIESGRMLQGLKQQNKEALFHVLLGYLYGSGVLQANVQKAETWAFIAAKLGNLLAFHLLGERSYPFPDRDYNAILNDLRTSCPSGDAEFAAEKAEFLRQSEEYLRIAAYYGHGRASEMLGSAYLWGYYGKIDKVKALNYFVQGIIQAPRKASIYRGAMLAALGIIDDELSHDKKFKQLSWLDLTTGKYLSLYQRMSKTVKTLTAVVEQAEELLAKRAFLHQRENTAVSTKDTQVADETITSCRAAVKSAKAKLQTLTLMLDQEAVLPSPANLNEFGVYFEGKSSDAANKAENTKEVRQVVKKLRELAAAGSVDAAIKLGELYAEGLSVKQDRDIAAFFYRQALLLKPDLSVDRHMHARRIQNEEARLKAVLERAMRASFNPLQSVLQESKLMSLPEETVRRFGIQLPLQEKSLEWNAKAINKPQVISVVQLEMLQRAVLKLQRAQRLKYLRILSALRDGDYAELPQIIEFYADNKETQFIWLKIAASHGHLPSLRLLGRMLREEALLANMKGSALHMLGVSHTALAAALGNFDATRDMIEIVENGELSVDLPGISMPELILFYKNQCFRQDPKRAIEVLQWNPLTQPGALAVMLTETNAVVAQAILQGKNDWRVYEDFCRETLASLQQLKNSITSVSTTDLRYIPLAESLFAEYLAQIQAMINLSMLKIELEYTDRPRAEIEAVFGPYNGRKSTLETQLSALENFSASQGYREAGVELPRKHDLYDNMNRNHQPWERNIIHALRSPDYSVELLYHLHSKTQIRLRHINHHLLRKMELLMLDNPADMLEMRVLCLKHGMTDLAGFWLNAAMRAGDPVARRMKLMQGAYTRSELAVLASHGELEATLLLAESSDTPAAYRPMLHSQAERIREAHTDRELYLQPKKQTRPAAVQQPQKEVSDYFKYFLYLLGVLISIIVAGFSVRRFRQYRASIATAEVRRLKNIEKMLTHFRMISNIEFHYDHALQAVIAVFKDGEMQPSDIRMLKSGDTGVLSLSASDQHSVLAPLLKRAVQALRHAKIIDQDEALNDERLLSLLGVKVTKPRKSDYHYKPAAQSGIQLPYDANIQRELFEVFVMMSGFTYDCRQAGVYHLRTEDQQVRAVAPAAKMFCSLVWNVVLQSHHKKHMQAQVMKQERLELASVEEKKYRAAMNVLASYDTEKIAALNTKINLLIAELETAHVKSARDVASLCEMLLARLDCCQEKIKCTDKQEVILYEAALTRGLLILKENHELRKRVVADLEKKNKHAVEKAAPDLDQYNGSRKRADKEKQSQQARKSTVVTLKKVQRPRPIEGAKAKDDSVANCSAVTSVARQPATLFSVNAPAFKPRKMLAVCSLNDESAVLMPAREAVVVLNPADTIFRKLADYFKSLQAIHHGRFDTCRDLIMKIGEVGQWLYQTCPQLKNEIFTFHPKLREYMYFIVMCHVLYRNQCDDGDDLDALYDSSMADFPLAADNLPDTVLSEFICCGIKADSEQGLCEELNKVYAFTCEMVTEKLDLVKVDTGEQELKRTYLDILSVCPLLEDSDDDASPRQRIGF